MNSTISSMRFRNSGRKTSRSASAERTFEVMMITVCRKSTVRPWPSVSRPSSRICSRTSKTSRVRLLDLVEQDDGVRAAPHGFRQLAALLVADVAGRRADEPRHRVPLLVLGHVEAHHRAVVVEHELGERARQLGLADAGRARGRRTSRSAGSGPGGPSGHGAARSTRPRPPRPGRRRARGGAPPCG